MKVFKNIKVFINGNILAIVSVITAIAVVACSTSGSNSSSVTSSSSNCGSSTPANTDVAIAGGRSHTLIIDKDGSLWTFGANGLGQLGLGNNVNTSTPTSVKCFINDASAVAAGEYHSLVLKKDGTLWSFGKNYTGQLGLGNLETTNNAKQVVGDASNGVKAIAAGEDYSYALKKDGTLWAFGNNSSGQLGLGDFTYRTTATKVKFGDSSKDIIAITAGSFHTLLLKQDGTVWSIGANVMGELGLGNTNNTSTFTKITDITGAVAVAAGAYHSLVLKQDGTVLAFGYNSDGQLGLGNLSAAHSPTLIPVTAQSKIKAIAAGYAFSLLLKDDGTVMGVGNNDNGQLGIGNKDSTSTPTKINDFSDVKSIVSGYSHSFAIKNDGTIWTFGSNYNGQLGQGTTQDASTPIRVIIP